MAKQKKTGLGRGLGALMGEGFAEASSPSLSETPMQEQVPPVGKHAAANTPEGVAAPIVAEVAADDLSGLTEGNEYVASENAAEKAEQAVVTERDARRNTASAGFAGSVNDGRDQDTNAEAEVPLAQITPNPDQPRTHFKKEEIEELASSIEREGLLQPILVRSVGDTYQIIAGERRYQACKHLGLEKVAVRIMDTTDDKAIELALVENIQRADLNPIEEAYGYRRLMERRGMTQSEVAAAVSKGRSTVANALRLLDLPEDAQKLLYEEKITAGHARAILSIPTEEGREKLTEKLKKGQMTVREAEAFARLLSGNKQKHGSKTKEPLPAYFKSVARSVRDRLKTNVRIRTVGGKNKLEIEFTDEDDLKRMLSKLLDG